MITTIILARHGATGANLENRFAGRSDEPLHRQGIEQLLAVAEGLKNTRLTGGIVCGPLTRTRQSAELVGRELSVPVRTEDCFTEIDIPHWDGLTKDEIRQRFGPEYPTWLENPAGFALPGCESLARVQERAVAGLERLFVDMAGLERLFVDMAGHTTLVISHLIVVRCLLLYYRGLSLGEFRGIKVDNGALIYLRRDATGCTEVGSV